MKISVYFEIEFVYFQHYFYLHTVLHSWSRWYFSANAPKMPQLILSKSVYNYSCFMSQNTLSTVIKYRAI
jgi:hypothetical protein